MRGFGKGMNLFGAAQAVMTVNPHVTYRICVFLGTATAAEIVVYLMIGVIKLAAQNAKLVATAPIRAAVPQDITPRHAMPAPPAPAPQGAARIAPPSAVQMDAARKHAAEVLV